MAYKPKGPRGGDEVYNGRSTRPPRRFEDGKSFRPGADNPDASKAGSRTSKPYSAPPRSKAPGRPVPPSMRSDASPSYPPRARRDEATGQGAPRYKRDENANPYPFRSNSPAPARRGKPFERDPRDQAAGQGAPRYKREENPNPYPFRSNSPAPARGDKPFGRAPRDQGAGQGAPRYNRDDHANPYPFRSKPPAPARRDMPIEHNPPEPIVQHAEPHQMYDTEIPENLLVGRNPIREAIKAGRSIEKLIIANGELSGSAREIVAKAMDAGVIVQRVDKSRLDAIYPKHQGMLAYVSAANYASIEDMLLKAEQRGEEPFLIVLDGITDPHNLGAIIRTAECAGAHGVIIPERRSAGLNPAAVKASAGALEYLSVAKVTNLTRTLVELKEKGLWITGGVMDGEPVDQADLSGPIALVIGSEGDGISQLVLKHCDRRVSLPVKGHIDSLNASVAAGILMYAVARSRG